jgi:serine/threonine protein kinase
VRVSPDLSHVKLADFAFSRLDALGMTGTISTGALSLGAFHYLAPEQLDAHQVDHRADLYSAGALFQEMLTGRPPGAKIGLPSQINSSLPPEVDVVVLKCLARNPLERYASAVDLLNAIERLEETMRVRLLAELRDITQSGPGSKALLWGVIVLVLAALVVAGVVLLR